MDDEEVLTRHWDNDTAALSYDIEEAFLKVLNKHFHGMVNPE